MSRITNYFKSLLLIELLKGMVLTGRYLVSPKYTMRYPMEHIPKSNRFRGLHRVQVVRGGMPRAGDHH
jgi:NADH-quinone oxidoreductase subunit I